MASTAPSRRDSGWLFPTSSVEEIFPRRVSTTVFCESCLIALQFGRPWQRRMSHLDCPNWRTGYQRITPLCQKDGPRQNDCQDDARERRGHVRPIWEGELIKKALKISSLRIPFLSWVPRLTHIALSWTWKTSPWNSWRGSLVWRLPFAASSHYLPSCSTWSSHESDHAFRRSLSWALEEGVRH